MKKDITLLEQLENSYKEQIEKLEEREKELKKKRLEFSSSLLQSDYQTRIIQAYQMLIELQTLKLKHQ